MDIKAYNKLYILSVENLILDNMLKMKKKKENRYSRNCDFLYFMCKVVNISCMFTHNLCGFFKRKRYRKSIGNMNLLNFIVTKATTFCDSYILRVVASKCVKLVLAYAGMLQVCYQMKKINK